MCGIAGLLADADPREMRAAVERMAARQQHRGPDDRRVVDVDTGGRRLVLGFDRLAVLDPSPAAAQPMVDAATGSWLVVNGEIYDFRALRAVLAARGRRFHSSGDAEVLLGALVEWGPDALRRVRGMYAFAFWDAPRRRLLLGRDPFGMKPLLYGRVGDAFLFASELRAIQAAAVGSLTIDREALRGYLAYGAVPEPHTIAREIRVLPPGCVLEVDADGGASRLVPVVRLEEMAERPAPDASGSVEDAAHAIRDVLAEAVRAHLVSDVPVGVLLSGGIDSAVVASLVDGAAAAPDVAFLTVGFDDAGFSEVPAAAATAARLAGRHEVVHVGAGDVLGMLPGFLDALDQPTADGVNTWVIARAAAERGRTVLLSGVGGDEVFGGYTTFRKAPVLAAHAGWLASVGRAATRVGAASTSQLGKMAAAAGVQDLRDAYLLQRGLGWDHPGPMSSTWDLPAASWEALGVPDGLAPYHAVSLLEIGFYLRSQLLRDADVMSSASSIELRAPFVDMAVLRAAWSLPGALHVGRVGPQKRVLRAVLASLRPAGQVSGRKRGFVFPWATWMRGPLGEHVAATLGDGPAFEALGLPSDLGRRTLAAWQVRPGGSGWMRPWSLYTLVEWQRRSGLEIGA